VAKVLDPLHSVEARGRVGGLVYNTWRGIRTVKSHTDPTHQDDPKRHAHFLKIRDAGKRWGTLDPSQRAAWGDFSNEHLDIDWTGKPVHLAGYHWYVRVQVHLKDLNLDYVDDPPVDLCLWTPGPISIDSELPLVWLMYPSPLPPSQYDTYMQVFSAGPHPPGRKMSLHDATLQDFNDAYEGFSSLYYPDPGYYTWFLRPVRFSGMVGTWRRFESSLGWP
jgi:hypothetical protein